MLKIYKETNHDKMMFSKISGFTIAEVFIALAVIAIICAVVLPTMNQSYNNQVFTAKFKRIYNQLNQATEAIMTTNQGSMGTSGINPQGVLGNSNETMRDAYANYLNYINICDTGQSGCWLSMSKYHGLKGSNSLWFDTINDGSALVLKDGSLVQFQFLDSKCTYNNGGEDYFIKNGTNQLCGWIIIDVNGSKGPNLVGRDVFLFDVTTYGLYPVGTPFDGNSNISQYCSTTSNDSENGDSCAARIMEHGYMDY